MGLNMNERSGTGDMVEVGDKLWLTESRDELVSDGDPKAAYLYCTPGMQVPREEAEKFGLLGRKMQQAPPNKARGQRGQK